MTRVRRHELETGKIEVVGLVFGERRLENGSGKRRQVQEGEEKLQRRQENRRPKNLQKTEKIFKCTGRKKTRRQKRKKQDRKTKGSPDNFGCQHSRQAKKIRLRPKGWIR